MHSNGNRRCSAGRCLDEISALPKEFCLGLDLSGLEENNPVECDLLTTFNKILTEFAQRRWGLLH